MGARFDIRYMCYDIKSTKKSNVVNKNPKNGWPPRVDESLIYQKDRRKMRYSGPCAGKVFTVIKYQIKAVYRTTRHKRSDQNNDSKSRLLPMVVDVGIHFPCQIEVDERARLPQQLFERKSRLSSYISSGVVTLASNVCAWLIENASHIM